MPSVRVSPGRLTALWVVLRALQVLGGEVPEAELVKFASRTSLRAGGLPIGDGLKLATEGSFVNLSESKISPTALGSYALSLGVDDEPTVEIRRLFASVLLLRDPPAWVAYWQGDPTSLDVVIPGSEREVLVAAGLMPMTQPDDLENRSWWDALARVPLVTDTGQYRKLIGGAGEELSLQYEKSRLTADGFDSLAARVRWVARESDAYGFDILSYLGGDAVGVDPSTPMAVEVKSLARSSPHIIDFYLSEHEWSTASRFENYYIVHFWDGVDPGPPAKSRSAAPRVLRPADLKAHLPGVSECNEVCAWSTARLVLR